MLGAPLLDSAWLKACSLQAYFACHSSLIYQDRAEIYINNNEYKPDLMESKASIFVNVLQINQGSNNDFVNFSL